MKFNYNIFKGILSLIVLSFLFVTLMPLVNSGSEVINTFLVYEDSASSTSKTVTQGDVFNVVMVAYGHGEALQNERLELVGSTLIFQEAVSGDKIDTYTWLYTKTYTLNTGILTPGTYTLRFTARTAITQSVEYSDLQLTILPKVNPIVCGNNIKEGTEQCDYGTDNGKPCNPLYGSSCTYCSSTCKLVTINGPSCGDGTCSAVNGETCSTCSQDCGVCPDNIKPVVDITDPLATTYTSHRTSLTFSVYDDNLQSCTYKLNGAPQVNVVSLKNGINIITGITSITGKNTWEVVCRDASGNTGTDSVTFTIACLPTCGDGTCNNGETCSTCPQDCGTCPKNCTVCKDSKPLDDSNYVPSGKTVIVYDDSDDSSLSDKQEKALDENKTPLIALILIIGILILLILVIIIRLARR